MTDFLGKVESVQISKKEADVTVTLRILRRDPGLMDQLLNLLGGEVQVGLSPVSYAVRLALGCNHPEEKRVFRSGKEVCSADGCGQVLGDCMHPSVTAEEGATTGTCDLCGQEDVSVGADAADPGSPDTPPSDAPEEEPLSTAEAEALARLDASADVTATADGTGRARRRLSDPVPLP